MSLLKKSLLLFVIFLPALLCKNINLTSVIEATDGSVLLEEEFNFEFEIPECNDTTVKSFVVDLYFTLKPESAPMLIGKLIQSCSYYTENNILVHDILKLIKLNGISFIEFVEWMKEILPEKIEEYLEEIDGKELEELTEVDFIYLKHKLIKITENLTYCEFIERNEWLADIVDKLWHVSDAFSVTFLDIMQFESFANLFMKYYTELNNLPVSGVFIDANSLVTNAVVYQKLKSNSDYVKLVGITLENCKRFEFNAAEWMNSHLIKLQSNHQSQSHIRYDVAKTDVLNDCVYMLKLDDEIKLNNFNTIKNEKIHLIAENFDKARFKVGNPLICNDTLYGLAEFRSAFGLNFASFYEEYVLGGGEMFTYKIRYVFILMLITRLM